MSGRKQRQQQHGRLPNCSAFCQRCCTRVSGSQSTIPGGVTASQYKHRLREAAAQIQTRTGKSCLMSWRRCTVRQCPVKPRQKRPRNTRHCKSLSSLLLSFYCCFYLKPNCQPARRVPTRPESKQRNTRLQKSHFERALTAEAPILLVCRSDCNPSASFGHPAPMLPVIPRW